MQGFITPIFTQKIPRSLALRNVTFYKKNDHPELWLHTTMDSVLPRSCCGSVPSVLAGLRIVRVVPTEVLEKWAHVGRLLCVSTGASDGACGSGEGAEAAVPGHCGLH